jgi:hypothetical protein
MGVWECGYDICEQKSANRQRPTVIVIRAGFYRVLTYFWRINPGK